MQPGAHSLNADVQPSSWSAGWIAGLAAVLTIAIAIYVKWMLAALLGIVIVALAACEYEPVLFAGIFLLPAAWVVKSDLPVSNVVVPLRDAMVIAFFVGRWWRGKLVFRAFWQDPITKCSVFFLVACCASIFCGSLGMTHAAGRALNLVIAYLAFYFFTLIWVDSQARLERILRTLFWSTICVSLFGIYQELVGEYTKLWMFLYPRDDAFVAWNGRVPSFLGYSNVLAGYLNLILPLALGCYWLAEKRLRKLALYTAVLGVIALVLTQSRGALGAFVCVFLWGVIKFIQSRKAQLAIIIAVVVGGVSVYLIGKVISPSHLGGVLDREAMERLAFWATAIKLFLQSPVFGVGIGNYSELYGFYIPSFLIPPWVFSANGLYFQILSEMGLVGMTSFLTLCWVTVRQAREHLRWSVDPLDQALGFAVAAGIAATMIHGLIDLSFDVSPQWGTMFFFALGLLAARRRDAAGSFAPRVAGING